LYEKYSVLNEFVLLSDQKQSLSGKNGLAQLLQYLYELAHEVVKTNVT